MSYLGHRMKHTFLLVYYLPVVVPTICTVLLWQLMFLPQGGFLNGVLGLFGVPPAAVYKQLQRSPLVGAGAWCYGQSSAVASCCSWPA